MPLHPNILFILTDNQRADLLGCAGHPVLYTPHIDALAARGVRFASAFATTPICAASRASYLTGCYERRHRFTFLTAPLETKFTDASYPALLKSKGYRTGFIGKFGVCANGVEPSLEDPNALSRMFDVLDNYEHWTSEGYEIGQTDGSKRHLTDITGDRAIDFLRSVGQGSDQPFCLTISFNAPHAQDGSPEPYVCPESERNLYQDVVVPEPANADRAFFDTLPAFLRESESPRRLEERFATRDDYQRNVKGLYRMVSGVDRNVGRILGELDGLALAENTVVIYASDHGMYYGDRGLCDCWQLNEESIRVPLIVCDPRTNVDSRGEVLTELALNIDVAPTILDFAGLDPHPMMQGRSLRRLIEDGDVRWRNEFFCEHLFDRSDIPKSEGVRTEGWKYIRYFEQMPVYEELYDLRKDPTERDNLATDPGAKAELDEMRNRCEKLRKEAM